MVIGLMNDVFHDHDGAIQNNAEVDGPHRDQIGGQAELIQAQKGHHQRQGNDDRHNEGGAKAAQEQPDDPDHQQEAMQQVVMHRVQRVVHQLRPVQKGLDDHALGQNAAVEFLDPFMHGLEDAGGILTASQQHDAFHHLLLFIQTDRTLARRRGLHQPGDVAYRDRCAANAFQDDLAHILGRA